MRRLLRWVIGLASALAVWRYWSRRRHEPEVAPEPDPAEELRRRLAEQHTDEAGEPAVAEEPVGAETLEERRARVHAKAQEAIDAMKDEET